MYLPEGRRFARSAVTVRLTPPSQRGRSIAWQDETQIPTLTSRDRTRTSRLYQEAQHQDPEPRLGLRPEHRACGAVGLLYKLCKSYRRNRPSVSTVLFVSSSVTEIFSFVLGSIPLTAHRVATALQRSPSADEIVLKAIASRSARGTRLGWRPAEGRTGRTIRRSHRPHP